MTYKEIAINTTTEASELVADILSELGSKGVGIYDSNDFFELKKEEVVWDYADEALLIHNKVVKVVGYFEEEIFEKVMNELEDDLQFLKTNCPFEFGSLEVITKNVDDEDWVNVWKEHYKPIYAGKLTIVPNWIEYKQHDDELIVRMDPGMAFGTGEHESTKMCLHLMQKIGMTGKRVIDVGTGSGILGIAACKLGAREVFAYDIDDVAVKSCKANAIINKVDDKLFAEHANLLDKSSGNFDIVLANITADPLIELSDTLKNYLNKGGFVIVSGIILKREKEVEKAYVEKGYAIEQRVNDGEWVAFKLRY